jgi:hypothetical protein
MRKQFHNPFIDQHCLEAYINRVDDEYSSKRESDEIRSIILDAYHIARKNGGLHCINGADNMHLLVDFKDPWDLDKSFGNYLLVMRKRKLGLSAVTIKNIDLEPRFHELGKLLNN